MYEPNTINTNYNKEENKKKYYIKNIVINLFFIISSIAFAIVTSYSVDNYVVNHKFTIITVGGMSLIYAAYNNSLIKKFLKNNILIKILSLISSISICIFYIEKLKQNIPEKLFTFKITGNYKKLICAILICSILPFCIEMFSRIYDYLYNIIKKVWKSETKINKCFFVITIIILSIVVLIAFLKVNILSSSSNLRNDIIYTSDNLGLLNNNAWLNVNHLENDIRQPLFALFAMPFIAPLYAFEVLSGIDLPISIVISNIILILASAYFLADIIKKQNKKTIFFVFYLCTYGPMLFLFMLEQYSVAVFWLILLLYMNINKIENRKLAMVGATGSLITTGIVFPMIYNKEDKISIRIKKIFMTLLFGIFIFLLFGKINMVLTLQEKIEILSKFTGKEVLFIDKFKQYTHFITNCFVSINAIGANEIWCIRILHTINLEGILILVLSAISFIVNIKDKLNRISFYWVIFSFIILCVVGWGTLENGLILYALYFSWAIVILMYNLIKQIFNLINKEKAFYVFIVILSLILLIYNSYNIIQMLMFLSKIQ